MPHANRSVSAKRAQAPRAEPVVEHAQTEYYDNEDLIESESECETPSDRSQVVRAPAATAAAPGDLARAQMYRQTRDQLMYRSDLYTPTQEYYYGAPTAQYRYATAPAPASVPLKKQRNNIASTHIPVQTRPMGRVCTAHALPAAPIHQYYPQQYAIPQPSMVLRNDGMMTYGGSGNDVMTSVPLVQMAQVPPHISGTVMYQQHAHRHSAHHMQVPLAPSNRFRSSMLASATNIRPPIPPSRKTNSISVRTPRYIRRPCTNSVLCKKPSALCLPLACQPDPAVHRRQSKPIEQQDEVQPKPYKQQPARRPKHPQNAGVQPQTASLTAELQPTLSQSQLDALFANYEELYLKATTTAGYVPDGQVNQPKGKIMATMMGLGPPRVPKHIQKKQQELLQANKQQCKKQSKDQADMLNIVQDRGDVKDASGLPKSFAIPKDVETFDVQEITSQVLQELMCDMATANEAIDVTETADDKLIDDALNDTDTSDCTIKHDGLTNSERIDKKLIDLHARKKMATHHAPVINEGSFNYQDIAQNISKSKMAFPGDDEEDSNSTTGTQKHSITSQGGHPKSDGVDSTSAQIRGLTSQKSLKCSRVTNVAEAMELHRTKSYVVNLIDTALSNHFGTTVCEKYSSYECSGLNPMRLIETLKKHSVPKLEKDVCLEIAQALNQTYSDFNTRPDRLDSNNAEDSNSKQESCCSCKGEASEPTYIKYLRQLRWGHLKHIQAEAKRLEELERFFDSCSKKAFCEKYP